MDEFHQFEAKRAKGLLLHARVLCRSIIFAKAKICFPQMVV
jgi:hypothetical protein